MKNIKTINTPQIQELNPTLYKNITKELTPLHFSNKERLLIEFNKKFENQEQFKVASTMYTKKFIGYNFSVENYNANIRNNLTKFLENFFLYFNCLISQPKFIDTPGKFILRINYLKGFTKGEKLRRLIHRDLYLRKRDFFEEVKLNSKTSTKKNLKDILKFIKLSTTIKRWRRYTSLRYILMNNLRRYALNLKINQSLGSIGSKGRNNIKLEKINNNILKNNQSIISNQLSQINQNINKNIDTKLEGDNLKSQINLINNFKTKKVFKNWTNLHNNTNLFSQKWAIKRLAKLNVILKRIFKKEIEIQLVRIYNIGHDPYILAKSLSLNAKKLKSTRLINKLWKKVSVYNSTFLVFEKQNIITNIKNFIDLVNLNKDQKSTNNTTNNDFSTNLNQELKIKMGNTSINSFSLSNIKRKNLSLLYPTQISKNRNYSTFSNITIPLNKDKSISTKNIEKSNKMIILNLSNNKVETSKTEKDIITNVSVKNENTGKTLPLNSNKIIFLNSFFFRNMDSLRIKNLISKFTKNNVNLTDSSDTDLPSIYALSFLPYAGKNYFLKKWNTYRILAKNNKRITNKKISSYLRPVDRLYTNSIENFNSMEGTEIFKNSKLINMIGKENKDRNKFKEIYTLPYSPGKISGIKIRIAGRLITERLVPKKTVKVFHLGSFDKNFVNVSETANIVSKNKRGAYNTKVLMSFTNY